MAKKDYPAWDDLNKKQRKLALAKWHERKDANDPDKKREAFLNEEISPGLTRRDLRRDTRSAAILKYGEADRQLKAQPARINDWFGQYKQAIAQARNAAVGNDPTAIGGYYGAAAQGVQNLQTGLTQAAQEQWAGQQAAMATDAQQRGANVDPVLAEQAKNAAGVRAGLTAGVGATVLGQAANEAAYLGRRRANADLGRVGALRENALARQELAQERGAFKADYRRQARADAIKNYLNQVAAESLITDRVADNARADTSLANTIANTRADNRRSGSQWANTLNRYGYTNGEWKNMSQAEREAARKAADAKTSDGKDRWGNTPKQRDAAQDSWNEAWRYAQTYGKHLDNEGELYDFLLSKDVNSTFARAAAYAQFHGRRLGKYKNTLRKRGVSKFPSPKASTGGGATGAAPAAPDGSGGSRPT